MHTKNLFVNDDGATLFTEGKENCCMGAAYGWTEDPRYDEKGELINKLVSNDEARANAKLWAGADGLADALKAAVAALEQCNHVPGVTEQAICAGKAALLHAGVE